MALKPYPFVYRNFADVPLDEFKARWPNFSPREIACRGTGNVAFDFDAMDKLQALRTLIGHPLIVNSAYRSQKHNKAVEGAANSQHLYAKAFDVSMSNNIPDEYEAAARHVGFTGFGFYPKQNFIHVDTGPARVWGTRFKPSSTGLPVERRAPPETLSQDKTAISALVGTGGSVAGAATMIGSLSALSPTAQIVAVAAFVVGIFALLFIFRRRVKALAE